MTPIDNEDRLRNLEHKCAERGAVLENLISQEQNLWGAINELREAIKELRNIINSAMVKIGFIFGGAVVASNLVGWLILMGD